jgi:hypothetical protein
MEDEQGVFRGESYECDWCGLSFVKTPITNKKKTRYYCSSDCARAKDFIVFALLSAFGFFASIAAFLVPIPDRFDIIFLGAVMGFIGFFCGFDNWKVRRRIPRGSRKEQYLSNDIG